MHLLFEAFQTLNDSLSWTVDHMDKLLDGANLYLLVRNEISNKKKEEASDPTKDETSSDEDASIK